MKSSHHYLCPKDELRIHTCHDDAIKHVRRVCFIVIIGICTLSIVCLIIAKVYGGQRHAAAVVDTRR